MAKRTTLIPFSAYPEDIEALDAIVDVRRSGSPTPGQVSRAAVLRALLHEEVKRAGIIVHI